MGLFYLNISFLLYSIYFIITVIAAPQQPEINDQFENKTAEENTVKLTVTVDQIEQQLPLHVPAPRNVTENRRAELYVPLSFTDRLCGIIARPFVNFVSAPKVNSVLRNIGTCIVNGAMEIITYYFPAPLIPLIATAAGMVIPFEPVVMLREKMPVTSYRRAFRTALNSFLSTFDRYRLDDEEDDPYMTRRFNRRLMNDDKPSTRNVKSEEE